jgi:hypothetical protein
MSKIYPPLIEAHSFIRSKENIIASYNWTDFASGLGFNDFYLCSSENQTFYIYSLLDKGYTSSRKTIDDANTYYYKTSQLNTPRILKGNAYFSAYITRIADLKYAVQVLVDRGLDIALGDINTNDTTVHSTTETSYVLKATYTINGYLNKITFELGRDSASGTARAQHVITYADGQTHTVTSTYTKAGDGYDNYEIINPLLNQKIVNVMCRNNILYNTKGVPIETEVSTTISTPTITSTRWILLEIPLTETPLGIGDRIIITVKKTSGSGNINIDPAGATPAKVSIPFKIEN